LPEFDWIFREIASGIKAVVDRFMESPYLFYSEQDMHAYLYHKLISGKLGEVFVETSFGDRTVLVHKEYPTLGKYAGPKGTWTRGHFDLAIVDPEHASESHWRTHHTEPPYARHRLKAAVEFGLNAIGTTKLDLTHFRKDLARLTDPASMVERGYLLFFVRRQDYPADSGMLDIIDPLPEKIELEIGENRHRADNLVVVYAECLSPASSRLKIIPQDRAAWVG